MDKKILFTATPTEKRAALLENNRIAEIVVERPDNIRLLGNIYRGRIVSVLPGIQAAFVDIGLPKAAFLHVSEVDPLLLLEETDSMSERFYDKSSKKSKAFYLPIEKILSEGQEILVQVIKEPIGTKGAKVTTHISLAGRFLVLIPDTDFIGVSKKTSDKKRRTYLKKLIASIKPPGIGFIVRTIGLEVSESEFILEIKELIEKWKKAQEEALIGSGPKLIYKEMGITTRVIRDLFSEDVLEVYVDQQEDYNEIISYLKTISPSLCSRVKLYKDNIPLFDKFDIEKDLEILLKRKVWLKSGGYIVFDHTEALLTIDVNTGRNIGKHDLEETIFRTNIEAAQEIARQLRLRDIGGIIVVDFIDMQKPEHRRKLEEEMQKLLRKDKSSTSCTSLSKFGLMEITRKRVRPELQELYTDVCNVCKGLGWVFSPATVAARIDRWLKRASPNLSTRELILAVNPSVASYLKNDNYRVLLKLEAEHNFKIKLTEDDNLDQDEYEFYLEGQKKPITNKFYAC